MKLSRMYDIEASWEVFRHDEELLSRVKAARSGSSCYGDFEVLLGESRLLSGKFDEPHDMDRYDVLKEQVLQLVEHYLEETLKRSRLDLESLGIEIDT